MGKPFKLTILSDFRDLLRQTKDAGEAFEDVGDALDGVARDSDKAADKLERSFTDALDDVKRAGKDTGKAVGDNMTDGAHKASEGMDDLKDEANSTAREAAASFDGSADSIADAFQEVAANAFAGFGPAGALAGLAIAAGIGIGIGKLTELAEAATENKQRIIDLARELDDVDGNPAALDWAERLKDLLYEVTDNKEWYEFWQDEPATRMEQWSDAARRYGLNMSDIARGIAGDHAAMGRVLLDLDQQISAAERTMLDAAGAANEYGNGVLDTAAPLRQFRDQITEQSTAVREAAELNREMRDAVASIGDAASDSATATDSYRDAVVDSLTSAGEGWERYVKNGKVNLQEYNKAIEDQAQAVQQFERNLVTASANLSQEALDYIRGLGPQAAPLLQAYIDAPLAQKQRTAANWNTMGKAASDGYRESLELTGATSAALSRAQATADSRPVHFPTALDTRGMSTSVANAAQSLTNNAPPVFLRTKIQQRVV